LSSTSIPISSKRTQVIIPDTLHLPSSYVEPIIAALQKKVVPQWPSLCRSELSSKHLRPLLDSLYAKTYDSLYEQAEVFPVIGDLLNSYVRTSFIATRVVIVGEGPYPDPCADGVAFESLDTLRPSLEAVCAELERDIPDFVMPTVGDLHKWTDQGILMLNYWLTSDAKHTITDNESFRLAAAAIKMLTTYKTHLVFMLWGAHAHKLAPLINQEYHCVLLGPHPSPRSGQFYGCKHFSKCNAYLKKKNLPEIKWQL
jgi:uracil-DNA glycosylase